MSIVSSLSKKIKYTNTAINDIQKALEEHGFIMKGLPLEVYGDKIREIESGGGVKRSECFFMPLPTVIDKPVLQGQELFILNPISAHVKDIVSKQTQDKPLIQGQELFILNPASTYIKDVTDKQTQDKDTLKVEQVLVLNNVTSIMDMTLPIEEV